MKLDPKVADLIPSATIDWDQYVAYIRGMDLDEQISRASLLLGGILEFVDEQRDICGPELGRLRKLGKLAAIHMLIILTNNGSDLLKLRIWRMYDPNNDIIYNSDSRTYWSRREFKFDRDTPMHLNFLWKNFWDNTYFSGRGDRDGTIAAVSTLLHILHDAEVQSKIRRDLKAAEKAEKRRLAEAC